MKQSTRRGNASRGAMIFEAWKRLGTIQAAADEMGINYNTARGDLYSYRQQVTQATAEEVTHPSKDTTVNETGNSVEVESDGETIKTLEQLLEASKVNLDLWKVERYEVKTYQGHRRGEQKHLSFDAGRITGTVDDDGESNVTTMYAVKAWLTRRTEKPFEDVLDGLLAMLSERPTIATVKANYPGGDYLLVPSLSDIHIGRLSNDGVYTPERARLDMEAAGDAVIGRALALGMQIERVLLPVGNDMMNADNLKGTTTKGTWQDMSAGQRDAVDAACKGHIALVEKFLQLAPVDIVIVPGNHDRYSTYWLGKVLESYFANHQMSRHVTVDNAKLDRKYYEYGENLIGLEHGDEMRASDLSLTMAQEARVAWGRTKYHSWLRGHFHKERGLFVPIANEGGVHIEVFPAFCPPGEWELLMGYVGTHRAAEARFYHREHGRAGNFPVFIDEL